MKRPGPMYSLTDKTLYYFKFKINGQNVVGLLSEMGLTARTRVQTN